MTKKEVYLENVKDGLQVLDRFYRTNPTGGTGFSITEVENSYQTKASLQVRIQPR
jgi:hypothetical protein